MDSYDDKREEAYWDLRKREEAEREREKFVKESLSPYKEIARDSLMKYKHLSEEEATKVVRESTNEQLESEVYAEGSIKYALEGIQLYVQKNYTEELEIEPAGMLISDEQIAELNDAIMNGPIDAPIFRKIGEFLKHFNDIKKGDEVIKRQSQAGEEIDWKEVYKASNESSSKTIISILSHIHDGWVEKNQGKFMARDKKYQHMPIELIGWEEAKVDLLFLSPILSAMHVGFSEEVLEEVYDERVKAFFEDRGITDIDELAELISRGAEFYPALEGQDAILDKLKDSKFVAENVIPSIKEKGVGSDKKAMEALGKLTPKKTISMKAVVSNSIENGITTDEVQKAEREENEIEQAKEGVEVND